MRRILYRGAERRSIRDFKIDYGRRSILCCRKKLKLYCGENADGKSQFADLPPDKQKVFGAIFETATIKRDYLNFGYRDMDETMFPRECDCPKSIIAFLTPTDNKDALLWRKQCLDTHSSKAHLAKLPIGAVIEFSRNGKTVRLEKYEAAYQFKKPFWWNGSNYYPKKYIPKTYKIIKDAL